MTDYTDLSRDQLAERLRVLEARLAAQVTETTEPRQSEQEYRAIIRTSMDGFWKLGPGGRILDCNEAAASLLGYDRNEFLDLFIHDIEAIEDEAAVAEHMRRVMAQGQDRFETRHRCKDGRVLDMEISAYHFADASGGVTFAFSRDITARKRAERELRESEALLRTVAENSVDAIWFIDRAHRLRYLNTASLDLLRRHRNDPGLVLQDLIGRQVEEIFGKSELSRLFRAADEEAMVSGRVTTTEDQVGAGEGLRNRLVQRVPLFDGVGCVTGMMGFARDITERKQAEAERLANLERQRDALVREVHHRIKNNLQGAINLLRQHIAAYPETREAIEAAIGQVDTIAAVHGLQSRLGAREMRLCEMLPTVCATAASLARVDEPPCVLDRRAGDIWLASGTAVSVALVLNELCLNALKHGLPAGQVAIELEGDGDLGRVRIVNPGSLPAGFDLASGAGCGTGLDLLRTLLPRHGARLDIREADGRVIADFSVFPPVTMPPPSERPACKVQP